MRRQFVTALAAVALLGGVWAISTDRSSGASEAQRVSIRPTVPGTSRSIPTISPLPKGACIGQSTSPATRFESAPLDAVLESESHFLHPATTARPTVEIEPPSGRAITAISELKYVDGPWTFTLVHDASKGWAVAEAVYCRP